MVIFVFGLIFLFFSYWINIPVLGQVEILPSFIGYAIMAFALNKYKKKSKHIEQMIVPNYAMLFLSFVYFISIFINVSLAHALINTIIMIILRLSPLYITYGLVSTLKDLEITEQVHLHSESAFTLWVYLVIVKVVAVFSPNELIANIAFIAVIIAKVLFLISFYRSINIYIMKNKVLT